MKDIVIKNTYQILDLLREELISNTFLAKTKDTDKLAIVRQFHLEKLPAEFHLALQEKIAAISKLDHPCLLRILDYDFEAAQSDLFLVYEKFDAKSVAELANERGYFSHEKVIELIERIKSAIDYLNANNYFHGSLNVDNVLVSESGQVKLADYVVENEINSFIIQHAKGGCIVDNAGFLAPEQILRGIATKSSDIYSLGVILYRIYTGGLPYKSLCDVKKIAKDMARGFEFSQTSGETIPTYISNLILTMMEMDSKNRLKNFSDVLTAFRDKTLISDDDQAGDHILKQLKGDYINNMKKQPGHKLKPQYKLLGIGATVLLLLFVAAYGFYQSYFSSIREVKVPDLRNVYKEEAVIVLKSLGLNPEIAGEVEDEVVSANHVVSTNPEIGRLVKEGRKVLLFISKGQPLVSVPILVGLDQQEALSALKEAHLVPKITEKIFSNTTPRGAIVAQDPSANTQLMPGAEVKLVLCDGYPVELTSLPSKDPASDKVAVKLKFSILSGWNDTRVKIVITNGGPAETVYDEIHHPGDVMLLEFDESRQSHVTVYYDGNAAFDAKVKDSLH